ncbi:flagellar basal body-associated FliL family protein [Hyphomicrobium sp.]|uniref:flagellar basal body-associated FliL family protein n=1 Tax=Hyphomicrobium sp. TaxID=82 RepID=UPI002BB7102C|nr:flagellar basal body-associated FliL family protein [Hyphomicrobium sp.]HRN88953.1 flagellar basal body-associated FliL family protein [Hyphomicrobium sp.]HRQ28390.1 flagellar basal body-associated FliL family protein [Hyphomicrobium sp.]
MAKKDTKSEGKGGGGLIGVVIVTVLALACGAGFGFYIDTQLKSRAVATTQEKVEAPAGAPAPAAPAASPTARLVALAPIVANLSEPSTAWMRVEASILVDDTQPGSDLLAAQLAEDILAYLRTTTLSQFQGASGFQNLREDFRDRAAIRDPGRIKDIIIHGVVVE